MKTLIKLREITQRILATAALFVVSLASNNASAQTRSYTLEVLQKTDYIIDEACDIVDYFYFNDGELIAKSMHFQDYAYDLYNLKQFKLSLQYSLMARGYAINAIEICDGYWQYYDYYYYGYSPVWGSNSRFTVKTGNVQLHWGLTNARYHSNLRVNWDLYFTALELNYYRNLPSEIVLLNGFYKHKGMVVRFNDRHINRDVYQNMRVNINKGRDSYTKSYHNDRPKHMPSKPKNIRPNNASAPTHTRRETMNSSNSSNNRRNSNNNTINNQPTKTQSQKPVTQMQERRQTTQGTDAKRQSSSSSSEAASSNNSSLRR